MKEMKQGKLYCSSIEEVTWLLLNNPIQLDNNIHIWKIDVKKQLYLLNFFQLLMNEEEEVKAKQFFHESDQQQYIIRVGVLRMLLGYYTDQSPESLILKKDKHGKPRLETNDRSSLHFNISHSGGIIVIAISHSVIGIDIEFVNTTFHFTEIVNQYFTLEEQRFINSSMEPVNNFYLLWTRKEAILKALSEGITDEGLKISCLNGVNAASNLKDDWSVNSFNIEQSYIGSIAFKNEGRITFLEYSRSIFK